MRAGLLPRVILVAWVGLWACGDSATGPGEDAGPWSSLADTPWPMYRHDPHGTGRSPFAGPVTAPEVRWLFPTGSKNFSSPVLGPDGVVYFGSDDKNFYCVDSTGTLVWKIETEQPIISAPLVRADGSVMFGTTWHFDRGGQLYRVDPEGRILWKANMGSGIASSLTIDRSGNVYFVSEDEHLYSVTPEGAVRWKVQAETDWISEINQTLTPVFSPDGETIYVAGEHLYALDLDGRLRWKFGIEAPIARDALVDAEGNVFFITSDYSVTLYSLSPHGKMRWTQQLGPTTSPMVYASPAADQEGNVYAWVGTTVYALSNSGRPLWELGVDTEGYAPLTCDSQGRLYLASTWSRPSAFLAALNSDGNLLWRLEFERAIDVNIVLQANGVLYFSTSSGNPTPQSKDLGLFAVGG